GDSAIVVSFGDAIDREVHRRVLAFSRRVDTARPHGLVDHVPAYASVTLYYEPRAQDYETFVTSIRALLNDPDTRDADRAGKDVEIPVCYGGGFGPDLEFVAAHNQTTAEEVVRLHSSASYVVYLMGFAPGFAYLGGLPDAIAAPRLDEPRALVPAGSVGIAGGQTGVYPIATPGGWRIIGRTPCRLFDPGADDPALLHAGDRVRFTPIDRPEFDLRSQTRGDT
ncbi:MAG: 5-oxoprolinase subunit PxpB, partial [Actinomycetota bacterium]|nr:5-oxoprolinase subunit PxpB [Actinomycetota bacterium]